ncbi:MAG: cytochrome P450, partial [Candidatus Rokubacteria bacterium]|nr:cytochrome P450 [Candidatus Rokubacteria bacterium]
APASTLADVARWAGDFVAATTPGATDDVVSRGAEAAAALQSLGRTLVSGDGLGAALARHAPPGDHDRVVANALGFLWQAYDATAALIGNTLLALARTPALREAPDLLPVAVEVARHDAPVQNTRRFVEDDGRVAGVELKRGDTILVLLAAANRDPAANAEPARFDAARAAPRTFTFGHGPHACPGAIVAATIAGAGVEALLAAGVDPVAVARGARYRPSANIRLPLFGAGPA